MIGTTAVLISILAMAAIFTSVIPVPAGQRTTRESREKHLRSGSGTR